MEHQMRNYYDADYDVDSNERKTPAAALCWKWSPPKRYFIDPRTGSNIYGYTDDVVVNDEGTEVLFHPFNSRGCAVIRGATLLGRNARHSFEVAIHPPFFGDCRVVGVGTEVTLLSYKHRTDLYSDTNVYKSLVGFDNKSWALNYDGMIVHNGVETKFMDGFEGCDQTVRIRLTYDGYSGVIMYHVDDQYKGVAFDNVDKCVYPMVGSSGRDTRMTLLWNKQHIGTLQSMCRGVIRRNIKGLPSLASLPLPAHVIAYLRFHC